TGGTTIFSVTFLSSANGAVCARYVRALDGTPCGTYAVVWLDQGANGSFLYTGTRPSTSPSTTSTTTTSTSTTSTTTPPTNQLMPALPTTAATAYQLNAQHSGGAAGSGVLEPLEQLWSVNVGGQA